jgi:glycosyltransferase involved in cell wall biosynthesis
LPLAHRLPCQTISDGGFRLKAPINVFFLCEEALSLFPGADHAPRSGGAGIDMLVLARALAEDSRFAVRFVFAGPIGNGRDSQIELVQRSSPVRRGLPFLSRSINRKRLTQAFEATGPKVIIASTAFYAPLLIEDGRRTGAKTIYRVASETDTYAPRLRTQEAADAALDAIVSADLVLTQTQTQHDNLLKSRGKESVVLPKGLTIPREIPPHSQKSGVLWVGSAQALKQPWYALDLAREFPDETFTMICPPGIPEVYEYVRRRACDISNVELIDRQLPFDEVQRNFDAASIFLYTSEFGSDPALTLMQAALGGCATVSQRLDPEGGAWGERGLLYNADGDYDRMRELLQRLLTNPDVREDMGERAFDYIRERHDIRVVKQQLIAQICNLVATDRQEGES